MIPYEIKFRQPIKNEEGEFLEWFYWGNIEGEWISWALNEIDTRNESQQFTMYCDKYDREIYGGDLVRIDSLDGIYEVIFDDGKWRAHTENCNGDPNTVDLDEVSWTWNQEVELIKRPFDVF